MFRVLNGHTVNVSTKVKVDWLKVFPAEALLVTSNFPYIANEVLRFRNTERTVIVSGDININQFELILPK